LTSGRRSDFHQRVAEVIHHQCDSENAAQPVVTGAAASANPATTLRLEIEVETAFVSLANSLE
jgi:hypothetical protein